MKTQNLKNTKYLKTLAAGRKESPSISHSFSYEFGFRSLFRVFDLS